MSKKTLIYILIAIFVIVLVIGSIVALFAINFRMSEERVRNDMSNPLRRSEKEIKKDMLKLTPIGTSKEEVFAIICNEEWYIPPNVYISGDHGITGLYIENEGNPKSIEVSIGTYTGMLYEIEHFYDVIDIFEAFLWLKCDTKVYVDWKFDENSALIGVSVSKTILGP